MCHILKQFMVISLIDHASICKRKLIQLACESMRLKGETVPASCNWKYLVLSCHVNFKYALMLSRSYKRKNKNRGLSIKIVKKPLKVNCLQTIATVKWVQWWLQLVNKETLNATGLLSAVYKQFYKVFTSH